ncbi:unnamed protein product [Pieris brassicae]|uniref:Uncharacterized protein n=2 Tax=Pieris brassicae TaxID=7116 RepID=A0A9P0XL07_PIEBR|nr:unnamed protein product [Pieris brassicae]
MCRFFSFPYRPRTLPVSTSPELSVPSDISPHKDATVVKMSRVGRTRRTRVYDCNYNKGESYYRPVLDRLDGKVPVAKEPERDQFKSDVENRIRTALDDIDAPADDLFDSRGGRVQRGRPLSSALEDDLTDDITESLKRLRASKKVSRFSDDIDFESNVSNLENRIKSNFITDKILESVGIGQSEVSNARRALKENEDRTEKRIARRINEENSLTKWTALKDVDEESAAVQRAKATRARLTDLEDEMSELSERTAAREKRAARLRALVADTEADTTVAASKITIRAEREKKQVTF